jgi:apolipoprotein N-acyltransferase
MRATEFGIMVVRLASSGISQIVGRDGRVVTKTGFPGQGEMIFGSLGLSVPGRLPLDHWLGPICSGFAGLVLVFVLVESVLTRKPKSVPQPSVRIPVAKL